MDDFPKDINPEETKTGKSGYHDIYTIGHGRLTINEIMRLLVVNIINTVVDVRSVPYSRISPQFNKRKLERTFPESGIEYRFAGKYLGGFPGGQKPESPGNPDWEAVAATSLFQRGIRRLKELAETRDIVLLCAEENPYRCHRHHLVTPALLKSGIRVIHLRHDGRKEAASEIQDSLFR